MKLADKDQMRRHLLLAAKIGLFGAVLALIAAFSAYYTVRQSVAGRDVQVPDLTGMAAKEASSLLKEKGLLYEEAAGRNDDRVEEGKILAQDPPPGSAIKIERKVKVVVSLGNKVTTIPDLRGLAFRRAQITLQQQGTKIGNEVYVYSRRDPENQVIAQVPLPGTAGLLDSKVSLLVSRGARPKTFVMPDLVGRPESEVVKLLAQAGLKAAPSRHEPTRPGAPGQVVAQDPEAGYPVRPGDLVTLTVSGEGPSGG